MSNRENNERGTKKSNPSRFYLDWSSDNKQIRYYDKEKGENQFIALPFKFALLAERHTVGGWNEPDKSVIYANEVKLIGKEGFNVKTGKGTHIVSGLYSEIKDKVSASGGHYQKSLYILFENEICKLSLKGSGTQAWGDFIKEKAKNKQFKNEIVLESGTTEKKGSIKFSRPVFALGEAFDEATDALVDEAYNTVIDYLSPTVNNNNNESEISESYNEVEDVQPVAVGESEDDLPF